MEEDLGLQGFQYNVILSVFYISYIVFEVSTLGVQPWLVSRDE